MLSRARPQYMQLTVVVLLLLVVVLTFLLTVRPLSEPCACAQTLSNSTGRYGAGTESASETLCAKVALTNWTEAYAPGTLSPLSPSPHAPDTLNAVTADTPSQTQQPNTLNASAVSPLQAQAREPPQAPAYRRSVKVFHFLIPHWGESKQGVQACGDIRCEWAHSEHMKILNDALKRPQPNEPTAPWGETVTLAVYNLHSWYERTRSHQPSHCELQAALTLAESEESRVRYGQLFDSSFQHFDGYSTTHPQSSVQRVYTEAFLDPELLLPTLNFSSLIKGASYVASDCHKHDSANANRDGVVGLVRGGFRVDGLGRCMHTATGPEGVSLSKSKDTRYSLYLKRQTIGRYLFNFAFENSYEAGYVTEKPFDALIAGTVPLYLGDATHLRSLLPHPQAALFVEDFKGNYSALAAHLTYLAGNESAYEEHRAWRRGYKGPRSGSGSSPLLRDSWFCRICQWAVREADASSSHSNSSNTSNITSSTSSTSSTRRPRHTHVCAGANSSTQAAPADWEGLVVRGRSSKQIYLVKGGSLRGVQDMDTFVSLGFDLDEVVVVSDKEVQLLKVGSPLPRQDTPPPPKPHRTSSGTTH